MRTKIDLYFIIYIVTIISFFTIESQLRDKKIEQERTLKQVSSLVLKDFIDLKESKVEKRGDGRFFEFKISQNIPYFEKASLIFKNVTSGDEILALPVEQYSDPNALFSELTNSQRQQINEIAATSSDQQNISVDLKFDISLDIFKEILPLWENKYGGKEVAEKLEKLVQEIINDDPTYFLTDNSFSLLKNVNIPWKDIEYVPMRIDVKFDNIDVIKGTKWKNTLFVNNVQETIAGQDGADYLDIFIDGKKWKGDKGIPETELSGLAKKNQKITIKAVWDYGEYVTSEDSFNIIVRDPEFKNPDDLPDEIFCSASASAPPVKIIPEIRGIKENQITVKVSDNVKNKNYTTKSATVSLGPYLESKGECSGEVELMIKVDGQDIKDLAHTIEVKAPPAPSISNINWDKSTGVATIRVVTSGYGNEIDRKQLQNGSYYSASEKNNKGKKIDGGQKMEYIYKIRAGNTGATTISSIRMRVLDKFGKETTEEIKFKKK